MTEIKFICETPSCQKIINNNCFSLLLLSDCCSKIYCSQCYNSLAHSCQQKKYVQSQHHTSIPCSRCKIKFSLFECNKCNQNTFCEQCCKIVHSSRKFSFHTISLLNNLNKSIKYEKQKKSNLNIIQQKQNILKIRENQLKTIAQTGFTHKTICKRELLNNLDMQNNLDKMILQLNLQKNRFKMKQITIRQNIKNLQRSIQKQLSEVLNSYFQVLQNCKLILKQRQINLLSQINKSFQRINIKLVNLENAKNLSLKIKRNQRIDQNFITFLNKKFKEIQLNPMKLEPTHQEIELKFNISPLFSHKIKKIAQQLKIIDFNTLISKQNKLKQDRQINEQKRKYCIKENKTKHNYLTSSKQFQKSYFLSSYHQKLGGKDEDQKNRKTSLQILQSQINCTVLNKSIKHQNPETISQISRIKSMQFLSQTKTSLNSLQQKQRQQNQQKSINFNTNKKNANTSLLKNSKNQINYNLSNTTSDKKSYNRKHLQISTQQNNSQINNQNLSKSNSFVVKQIQQVSKTSKNAQSVQTKSKFNAFLSPKNSFNSINNNYFKNINSGIKSSKNISKMNDKSFQNITKLQKSNNQGNPFQQILSQSYKKI